MRRDSSRENGKFGPARGYQRLKVKLLAVDALPNGPRFKPIAVALRRSRERRCGT
jgi:hypothetical protein